MELHFTATECHLPYEITQCYLPTNTSEHSTSQMLQFWLHACKFHGAK